MTLGELLRPALGRAELEIDLACCVASFPSCEVAAPADSRARAVLRAHDHARNRKIRGTARRGVLRLPRIRRDGDAGTPGPRNGRRNRRRGDGDCRGGSVGHHEVRAFLQWLVEQERDGFRIGRNVQSFDLAVFNEREYTPAGEVFDGCVLNGIDATQWCGAPRSDWLVYRRCGLAARGEHSLALSSLPTTGSGWLKPFVPPSPIRI
jgi:hypothetical protein